MATAGAVRSWVNIRGTIKESTFAPCRQSYMRRPSPSGSQFFVRSVSNVSRYRVSTERLMNDIHHTSQWGIGERWGQAETETGMSRLSLSDADKTARDWFTETTEALGCTVSVDEMGNQFAIKSGQKCGIPTFTGSHLDTQPTGGRYDGVLGVTAGIEMLRVLRDNELKTKYPVGVVNWTNEEGARFPKSMVASGVWAGDIPLEKAHNLASVVKGDNATMLSELLRIGYKGDIPCSYEAMPMAAHFELHIEQGPTLEKAGQKIGIVTGAQAYNWFTIDIVGRDAHAGSTALADRADALYHAASMMLSARKIAAEEGGLATIGIIEAKPGSTNTIPGHVRFSLDVRGSTSKIRDAIWRKLKEVDGTQQLQNGVEVEWTLDFSTDATVFSERCTECVRLGTYELFGSKAEAEKMSSHIMSGAGHDSVYASRRCPSSMIFVPSRDGVSHNPREYSSPEDCGLGAQVLANAVLKFDEMRNE